MQKSLNLFRNLVDWYNGLELPSHVHHPLPREGNKVSCVVSCKDKTHPNHLSQTILNRLFGRVLEREGVSISCAEHTVKHLFSYSPIHLFTSKKAAFTLAEVLITLAIIGVVAALTLPSLIANYQKQVYVNQLKSAYSILGQGFKKMLADEGVDSLLDIPEFANAEGCAVGDNTNPNCVALTNKMQKYFKFTVVALEDVWNFVEDVRNLGDNNTQQYGVVFIWSDSALIFSNNFLITMSMFGGSSDSPQLTKDLGGHITSYIAQVEIDINGYKGSNMLGRDYFLFVLGSDGNLYPLGGIDHSLLLAPIPLESNDAYWKNSMEWCGDPNSSNIDGSSGLLCAARIMENGWKMDY